MFSTIKKLIEALVETNRQLLIANQKLTDRLMAKESPAAHSAVNIAEIRAAAVLPGAMPPPVNATPKTPEEIARQTPGSITGLPR